MRPGARELADYPLPELRLAFRVLHGQLAQHPDLLDAALLDDLQRLLQRAAAAEGVDIADHGAWDSWLGNDAVACETRLEGRRRLL